MKTPWSSRDLVRTAFCALLVGIAVNRAEGTHRLGSVLNVTPAKVINGASGPVAFSDPSLVTKYLVLHFSGVSLEGGDQLLVTLGYDTDVFTAGSGSEFWTRPIKGGTTTITYLDDGDGIGSVTLDQYGRGEESDVFLLATPYVNPGVLFANAVCPPASAPSWQNVWCLNPSIPAQLSMSNAARATGMILFVGVSESEPTGRKMTSCSAALIGPDLILTAAHCFDNDLPVVSGSFTLDFQSDCSNNRLPGYNPKFFKVLRRVRSGWLRQPWDSRPPVDYSILQLDIGPAGIGAPPLTMRAAAPVIGESMFEIHHPRGATKKVSRPGADDCLVLAVPPATESCDFFFKCDLDSGSSGSPIFDALGQIIGVADCSGFCSTGNGAVSTTKILQDINQEPPPPTPVSTVTVFDRSGSMGLSGLSGATKMHEAQEAAALFVDLLKTGAGHKLGLVSFSSTAFSDHMLGTFNNGDKNALIGPPPDHDAGTIRDLMSGGNTSIGAGLQLADGQLDADASGNTRAILLMTDGLQNTLPTVQTVEPSLGATRLCVVGFGTEASLDGPLLSRLAGDHGGVYTRAGEGLQLKKFFVLCFGNIFNSGLGTDPFYVIPADATSIKPIPLSICDESSLTVVLGWEQETTRITPRLELPSGTVIGPGTAGLISSFGPTWHYLQLPLPFNGEGAGPWRVLLDFVPQTNEQRFFLTTVVDGGPSFRVARSVVARRYYTGDSLNPLVMLRYPAGFVPSQASATVEIERPLAAPGNILTQTGLGDPFLLNGDAMDARSSRLISLERQLGILVPTRKDEFALFDDAEHEDGTLEPDGIFGQPLPNLTEFEGTYSFRAVASYGSGCRGTRETSWSVHVDVGIDPGLTAVTAEPLRTLSDGRHLVRMTIIPRDRYGNYLGPGRATGFELAPGEGTTLSGGLFDGGYGSYVQDVLWSPAMARLPSLVLTQPERPSAVTLEPSAVAISLISTGAVWRYLDAGVDLGRSWRAANYDDTNWRLGTAQLGFGDGDEATTINGGPSNNRHPTIYFRKSFAAPHPEDCTNLLIRLLRDDGAVVYLNDQEVFRSNMPTGEVLFATLALSDVSGADESTNFHSLILPPALLSETNLLAVEVHQASQFSDDLSFDLELICNLAAPGPPVLAATRTGNRIIISWTPPLGTLQAADDVAGRWTDVPDATNPHAVAANAARRFYRVRL